MIDDWKHIKFGKISDFKNGINFEKDQKGEIGVPTIDVKNMYTSSCYVNTRDLYSVNKTISKDYYLQNGDLLFVRSSLKEEGVGWTSLYNGEPNKITYCGFIIRARLFEAVKNDIDTNFLTYFFRTEISRKELVSGSGRVAITNINQGLLQEIKIPIPTITEQRKITYVLNTVQKAIEQQGKLIYTTMEIKKSLMQKLFTEGTKGEKQKQTEIGLVPKSWEIKKLGKVADVTSGGTPSRTEKEYWDNGTIPWVKTGEVNYCIIEKAQEYITEKGLKNSSAKLYSRVSASRQAQPIKSRVR